MNANMCWNGYIRDSFDRFGDDLCEHILRYLSLTECFRYECVAKQWKRLIFNKQNKLEIQRLISSRFSLKNIIVTKRNEYFVNSSRLECVLQKCRFISDLNFDDINLTNNDIDLITNNCLHLKSLKCYVKVLTHKSLILFATKFAQTLEVIEMRCDEYVFKTLIHLMPNLRKVYFKPSVNKHELNIKSLYIDCNSNPVLPKLQEIVLSELFYLRGFESFAETYCKQIKNIKVSFQYKTLSGLEKPLVNQFLTHLKRFDNLEKLDLDFSLCDLDLIDAKRFRLFGKKCVKLSELRISGLTSDISKCFDNNFVSLRHLSLNSMPFDGGVECFTDCTHLTHLSLYIDDVTDISFIGIDVYLPNLKDLTIFCSNTELTDDALRYLSKLKRLSYLRINKWPDFFEVNENITDAGICDVIRNCRRIKRIEVHINTKVSHKSLNAFIQKAKQCPKLEFYFSLRFNANQRMVVNNVPNNMYFEIIT